MNKYIAAHAFEKLIVAETLLRRISADGSYAKIMSAKEYAELFIAVTNAKDLFKKDLTGDLTN